jgi:hypothetical protein
VFPISNVRVELKNLVSYLFSLFLVQVCIVASKREIMVAGYSQEEQQQLELQFLIKLFCIAFLTQSLNHL